MVALVVHLLISILHIANSLDSDTLLQFKHSLSNGDKLSTWNTSTLPCNVNRANWNGLLCTNGMVSGVQLEGIGLQGNLNVHILAKLKSLVTLRLRNNNLEGALPDFSMLPGMRTIYLSNNKFSGEIPANTFNGMPWLRKVFLSNNEFTGKIPLSLTTLPRLGELMLENNQFEGEIPNFRKDKLVRVSFANNRLHGRIPEGLNNINASSFSGNSQLCGPPLGECKEAETSIGTIIVVVVVVAAALAAITVAFLILCCRRSRNHPTQEGPVPAHKAVVSGEPNRMKQPLDNNPNGGTKVDQFPMLTFLRDDRERIDLPNLLNASAEVLGSGAFGSAYKATLSGGKTVVVVKRYRQMNNVGKEEFQEHMKRLGKLRHPNIHSLVAFYYRKEDKLLVFDYIDNISLAFHLHGNRSNGNQSLNWPTRLKILKGVAKGLLNLYNELPCLIAPHGHLKSSNVLLTNNYEPLLTDYGLVPITNHEHSHDLMIAYKSPEYKQFGRISKKTDVWSLGILILETLTGKFPTNFLYQGKGSDSDPATFVNSVACEELNIDVFDKDMGGFDKSNESEMVKLLKIGLSCCEADVNKRWGIKEVVERIEEVKEKDGGGGDDD